MGVPGRHLPPHPPRPAAAPRRNIIYLLGRNPYLWCLEWDSLKFSVWHTTRRRCCTAATTARSAWRSNAAPAASPMAWRVA